MVRFRGLSPPARGFLKESERENMEKYEIMELVLAAQQGDRQAFGRLVEAFQGAVLAIAERRVGNYAEAQELTQEVFVQAMRKIAQLKQPECFGGWLRSIAVRMSINRSVRRGLTIATEPETMEANCVEHVTPVDNALANERTEQLREGLARLKKLDRQTLQAFYLDGQSIEEMSDAFASPVGTIKRRLHIARKRLAEELAGAMAV